MRRLKMLLFVTLEVILILTLFGCSQPKYRLNFGGYGFQAEKTEYAAGETVTAYFDMIATDTNYQFYLDDDSVPLEQGYDDSHGFIFTFTMPAHDVTLYVESYNSMVFIP